jgi:hypothetical protein
MFTVVQKYGGIPRYIIGPPHIRCRYTSRTGHRALIGYFNNDMVGNIKICKSTPDILIFIRKSLDSSE